MKNFFAFAAAGCALLSFSTARAEDYAKERLHGIAVQAIEQRAALDAPTAERAQSIVERFREPIKAVRHERRMATRELRRLLRNEKPDDARVKKLEAKILDARAKLAQLDGERLHELGRALTPKQLGQLLVSWNAINRSIRKQIRAARADS